MGILRVPGEKVLANYVLGDGVIRRMRELLGFIGFKGSVGGGFSKWLN